MNAAMVGGMSYAAARDIRRGQAKDKQLMALNSQLVIAKHEDMTKFAEVSGWGGEYTRVKFQ